MKLPVEYSPKRKIEFMLSFYEWYVCVNAGDTGGRSLFLSLCLCLSLALSAARHNFSLNEKKIRIKERKEMCCR